VTWVWLTCAWPSLPLLWQCGQPTRASTVFARSLWCLPGATSVCTDVSNCESEPTALHSCVMESLVRLFATECVLKTCSRLQIPDEEEEEEEEKKKKEDPDKEGEEEKDPNQPAPAEE